MRSPPGLLLLLQALAPSLASSLRRQSEDQQDQVFLDDSAAHKFLGRKPLYNHWDFELVVRDNLQRECIEEICNYEEAREVFEDDIKTAEWSCCSALPPNRSCPVGSHKYPSRFYPVCGWFPQNYFLGSSYPKQNEFWDSYRHNGRGGSRPPGVDVAGLVAGLIAAVVATVMFVIVAMYCVKYRAKERSRSRTQENLYPDMPLASFSEMPKPEAAPGLPSYEQALASSGVHDAPPPPYNRNSTNTALPT